MAVAELAGDLGHQEAWLLGAGLGGVPGRERDCWERRGCSERARAAAIYSRPRLVDRHGRRGDHIGALALRRGGKHSVVPT